ncbi:HDOD domain-containing protein [Rugamonas sp.]|uniref:HDOD domain-containing protein n=1 Tax=Rugamonas sp. TaxID=1926287 RepID=UPI0025D2EBA8|nr:HDOD domain-containing protein [Rugamonas sp.]
MIHWLKRLLSTPAAAPLGSGHTGAAQSAAPAAAPHRAAAPAADGPSFEQKQRVESAYYRWLFATPDTASHGISPDESRVLDSLSILVESGQSGAALVRRMPGLIPQVLQSLRSESFSGAEIARKISADMVLVAAVIRLANNTRQSGATRITSVEHAIIVIGQNGLRQLITAVALWPIADLKSGPYTRQLAPRLWEQAECCGLASRMMAAPPETVPMEAFLAGLIQYVGLLVSLRIMDQAGATEKMGSPLFCLNLLRLARRLSCRIAQDWDFSPSVMRAIEEQQRRRSDTTSAGGVLLGLADYLSKTKILADHGLLDETDSSLFDGLAPAAVACYANLGPADDRAAAL